MFPDAVSSVHGPEACIAEAHSCRDFEAGSAAVAAEVGLSLAPDVKLPLVCCLELVSLLLLGILLLTGSSVWVFWRGLD